jgi:hypothetical protein
MINKTAAITLPMAARMQNTKAKWKELLSIPSSFPYNITPIRITTPAIKQCTAPLYSLSYYLIRRVTLHNVIDHSMISIARYILIHYTIYFN